MPIIIIALDRERIRTNVKHQNIQSISSQDIHGLTQTGLAQSRIGKAQTPKKLWPLRNAAAEPRGGLFRALHAQAACEMRESRSEFPKKYVGMRRFFPPHKCFENRVNGLV